MMTSDVYYVCISETEIEKCLDFLNKYPVYLFCLPFIADHLTHKHTSVIVKIFKSMESHRMKANFKPVQNINEWRGGGRKERFLLLLPMTKSRSGFRL